MGSAFPVRSCVCTMGQSVFNPNLESKRQSRSDFKATISVHFRTKSVHQRTFYPFFRWHPHIHDFMSEFCKVIRNHASFSPARKTCSVSVLALLQGRNHARLSSKRISPLSSQNFKKNHGYEDVNGSVYNSLTFSELKVI